MESFEQVSQQYTPMIYSIIRKLHIYKNKDEFFQVGLIALWEAYDRFNPEKGQFTSFAYTYINGRILTELKKKRKDEKTTIYANDDYLAAIEDGGITDPLEEEILLSYCTGANLTENQTKYILYTFLKGLKVNEIAAIEHVSPSTVKAWRSGAKTKLRTVK
jgi:RNA polymerase sigma factor (sigma-70 family)